MSQSRVATLKRIFRPSKEVYEYFRSVLAPVLWETINLFLAGWHGPKRAPQAMSVLRRLGVHLVRETREFLQKEFNVRTPEVRQDLQWRAQLCRVAIKELRFCRNAKRVRAHNASLSHQIKVLTKCKLLCRKHQVRAEKWVIQRLKDQSNGLYTLQWGKGLHSISEKRKEFSELIGYTEMQKLSPLDFNSLDLVRFKYSSHIFIRHRGVLIRATRILDEGTQLWWTFQKFASVKLNAEWRKKQLLKDLYRSRDEKYLRDLGASPAQLRHSREMHQRSDAFYVTALQRMSGHTARGSLRKTPLKKLKERRLHR